MAERTIQLLRVLSLLLRVLLLLMVLLHVLVLVLVLHMPMRKLLTIAPEH